jgi:uncharacterized protein involved in exopolysaccharide biosynthesis
MTTPRFDLIDIAKTLQRRKKYILIITLITTLLGAAMYFSAPKTYKGEASFFVANPLYTDRSNVFRSRNAAFINYFGSEDDIDKVIAIGESDEVGNEVIERQNLAKVYKMKIKSREDSLELLEKFQSNFTIIRTKYQGVEVSFKDKNPEIAANVANEAVSIVGALYKDFYSGLKVNVCNSLRHKIVESDSAIKSLVDTISRSGNALEKENALAIKDQLIKDRVQDISLLNEFSTGIKSDEMSLIRVISTAKPEAKPEGMGLMLTIISFAFVGFFFSAVWVLLSAYFKVLTSVER